MPLLHQPPALHTSSPASHRFASRLCRLLSPLTSSLTSLYEYAAGFLWGGFQDPLSKTSAIYQIMLGFIMLVIISSYTANLAAFITLSASPTNSMNSMAEVRFVTR